MRILIPLIITLLILFFLFSKIDYNEVGRIFAQSNKFTLLLATLVFFLSPLISALRWKTIIKLMNCDIAYKTVLSAYLANIPIAKMSPLNSGDFARALYLKNKISISKNLGIIFLENLLDLMLVSFLTLVGGLILKIKIAIILGLAVFLLSLGFFIFTPKVKLNIKEEWKIKLANFSDVFRNLIKKPISFFLIIFYTFLSWSTVLICFKILFYSLGLKIPFLYIVAAQPIAILFGLMPITISGVGARESVMAFLYYYLASPSSIMAVGLIYSFLVAILLPLLCLPLLFIKARGLKLII